MIFVLKYFILNYLLYIKFLTISIFIIHNFPLFFKNLKINDLKKYERKFKKNSN